MGATTSVGSSESHDYEIPEPGVYPARCIQVVELGTHPNTHPQAKPGSVKKELFIVWELSELMEDGRPFTVNKRYTNSLSEKAILRKELESWRGKPFTEEELKQFSLGALLDKGCQLNLVHKPGKKDTSKTYCNVATIMPLGKGQTLDARQNELVDFGICDLGTPEFDKIWPWVQNIIKESEEGKRFFSENPLSNSAVDTAPEDGAPF